MRDERLSTDPPDDGALDEALTSVARFRPGRGFADRVLTRVRLPLPRWLVPTRNAFRRATTGVRGWTLLAAFSLASLGAWGIVGGSAWRKRDLISDTMLHPDVLPLDLAATEVSAGMRSVIDGLLAVLPFSLARLKLYAILYAVLAFACLFGLWWLTRAPHTAGVTDHAH